MEDILIEQQNALDRLRIVYGDNVELLGNNIVIVYESEKEIITQKTPRSPIVIPNNMYAAGLSRRNNILLQRVNPQLLTLSGEKILEEKIENAVRVINGRTGKIDGIVVFSQGDTSKFYENNINGKIKVISNLDGSIGEAKLQSRDYSLSRPDLLLIYNFKRYMGRFDEDGRLRHFISPS